MARYNFLASGYLISNEQITRGSSTSLRIGHDMFIAAGFEIWTGPGKTGTKLTLTTDYTFTGVDADHTTKVGQSVYTKLSIINGAYQGMVLYLTYTTVGDYGSVENVQELALETTVEVSSNYTVAKGVSRIIVTTANAMSITIPSGFDLHSRLTIKRNVSSANSITAIPSGSETIEGGASFVTHGSRVAASLAQLQEVTIELVGTNNWRFVEGVVSGSMSGTGYINTWEKYPNRTLKQRIVWSTTITPNVASGSLFQGSLVVPLGVSFSDTSYTAHGGINFVDNGSIIWAGQLGVKTTSSCVMFFISPGNTHTGYPFIDFCGTY